MIGVQEEMKYRAILVGVEQKHTGVDGIGLEVSVAELKELAKADHIETVGIVEQRMDAVQAATYIGRGKVEEIAELVQKLDANIVVFDVELSGIQIRNLEEAIGVDVIDRSTLILDIFASRATSREAKLQVELAQLQYRLPRLIHTGRELSRLGGGIGTRGPGEKKLETDRRKIRKEISEIRSKLKEVKQNRDTQRQTRVQSDTPIVSLIGYTNAGKSTLLNVLSDLEGEENQAFVKDMLFATLDTLFRKAVLPNGMRYLLNDTVGFVSNLPHHLVEAFQSTLEDVRYSDLLLHVVDMSNPNYMAQIEITNQVLKRLKVENKPCIYVFNKMDIATEEWSSPRIERKISVSAKTGQNIDLLKQKIEEFFEEAFHIALYHIPFDKGDVVNELHKKAVILEEEYTETGYLIKAKVKQEEYSKLFAYQVPAREANR